MTGLGTNTLHHELDCPRCGAKVSSGIGFQVGAIKRANYRLGERISWDGPVVRPAERPQSGNLRTIGYFNCDNPRCESWQDCFPEVQEALITIADDIIADVCVIQHKPDKQDFDILEA